MQLQYRGYSTLCMGPDGADTSLGVAITLNTCGADQPIDASGLQNTRVDYVGCYSSNNAFSQVIKSGTGLRLHTAISKALKKEGEYFAIASEESYEDSTYIVFDELDSGPDLDNDQCEPMCEDDSSQRCGCGPLQCPDGTRHAVYRVYDEDHCSVESVLQAVDQGVDDITALVLHFLLFLLFLLFFLSQPKITPVFFFLFSFLFSFRSSCPLNYSNLLLLLLQATGWEVVWDQGSHWALDLVLDDGDVSTPNIVLELGFQRAAAATQVNQAPGGKGRDNGEGRARQGGGKREERQGRGKREKG